MRDVYKVQQHATIYHLRCIYILGHATRVSTRFEARAQRVLQMICSRAIVREHISLCPSVSEGINSYIQASAKCPKCIYHELLFSVSLHFMINNKKRESGKHFLKYRLNLMEILNYNSLINLSVENNQKYSNAFILYK